MIRFVLTFLITFVLWILFTLSLGTAELIAGAVIAFVVALLSHRVVFHKGAGRFLHPMRWGAAVMYFLVFIYVEIKSHLDLAYRIITGDIKPAIIEIPTQMTRDSSRTLLGNTITLTPGTMTIKTGSKFLVHWICYRKDERPGSAFEKLGRVIAE